MVSGLRLDSTLGNLITNKLYPTHLNFNVKQ